MPEATTDLTSSTATKLTIRPAAALAAAALAAALFIGMDATVKTLAHRFDALQLTFLRFAAGSLFALPLWAWFRTPMPARASWRLHALRSGLLLLALLGWFHSLTLLPLVQAVAVGYTAPLFISLLAMLVLKERPSRWIWLALALGAGGAAVALWPEWVASGSPGSSLRIAGIAAAGAASGLAAVAAAGAAGVWAITAGANPKASSRLLTANTRTICFLILFSLDA